MHTVSAAMLPSEYQSSDVENILLPSQEVQLYSVIFLTFIGHSFVLIWEICCRKRASKTYENLVKTTTGFPLFSFLYFSIFLKA